MQTFGTYLKTRRKHLGWKQKQLCDKLIACDSAAFGKVDEPFISRWENDKGGIPKIDKLKKIILLLEDDPSAVVTTLQFNSSHQWRGRLLAFLLRQMENINSAPIIGAFLVQRGHRWHDMTQQFHTAYAQQLLEIDHELLPGDQYHASIEQLQAFAQMPGCIFKVLENSAGQYRGHILCLPLKLDVFDAIATGQRMDISITEYDIAQPGQPYGLSLYSYYAHNPLFAAELIAKLFGIVARSNGLCLKTGGCTGVASGLHITQCFGFQLSYGHPADADTLRPFEWEGQQLAYAIYAADTYDLYAKLSPEVMSAFATELA